MPAPLQSTFEVKVNDGESYEFSIPDIKHDIRVSHRALDVRRRTIPESGGDPSQFDWGAVKFSQYCAYLELYLVRSSVLWPYGIDETAEGATPIDFSKPPKVDFEKFPPDRTDTVYAVGMAFEQEAARFRKRGDIDPGSSGS